MGKPEPLHSNCGFLRRLSLYKVVRQRLAPLASEGEVYVDLMKTDNMNWGPRLISAADTVPPDPEQDTALIVERVRQGSPEGMEDLYNVVRNVAEGYFCSQFGRKSWSDMINDLYLLALEAISGGDLRDSAHLMGFVRTVVRYQALVETRRVATRAVHAARPDQRNGLLDKGHGSAL